MYNITLLELIESFLGLVAVILNALFLWKVFGIAGWAGFVLSIVLALPVQLVLVWMLHKVLLWHYRKTQQDGTDR